MAGAYPQAPQPKVAPARSTCRVGSAEGFLESKVKRVIPAWQRATRSGGYGCLAVQDDGLGPPRVGPKGVGQIPNGGDPALGSHAEIHQVPVSHGGAQFPDGRSAVKAPDRRAAKPAGAHEFAVPEKGHRQAPGEEQEQQLPLDVLEQSQCTAGSIVVLRGRP